MRRRPDSSHRRRRPTQSPRRRLNTPGFWAVLIIAVLVIAWVQVLLASQPHPEGRRVDFSRFVQLAERGAIEKAIIRDQDSHVEGTYRLPRARPVQFHTPFLKSEATRGLLVEILEGNEVPTRIDQQLAKVTFPYLTVMLPTLILVVLLAYFIIA